MIRFLRIPNSDVAGYALFISEESEQSERCRQALLAMQPFFFDSLENRRAHSVYKSVR